MKAPEKKATKEYGHVWLIIQVSKFYCISKALS